MAGQRQDRLRARRRWGAVLSLALILCVAWPIARGMAQGVGQGERQGERPGERLVCIHPLDPAHPLVTGFLAPWAHGVSVDSGGALGVEMRAAPPGARASCALAPLAGPVAEAIALPFAAPSASEDASAAAWTAAEAGALAGRLALIVDGPGALILADPEARPLSGSLQGVAVHVPSESVGSVLAELDAAFVLAPARTGTGAAVVPLSEARGAAWLMPIGGDRSLHGRAYALEVAPGYLATLDAATRATLTRERGLALSRAAGRAIDRASAVTLEEFEDSGRAVPLAEDAVGRLLSAAAAIRAGWAVTAERARLLDRLGGAARDTP